MRPVRSNHVICLLLRDAVTYATRVFETEKLACPAPVAVQMSSATGVGDPESSRRFASNGCAMSVCSRTNHKYPPAYAALYSLCTICFVSCEPITPPYTPRSSRVPLLMKNRKWRPSGRNDGHVACRPLP